MMSSTDGKAESLEDKSAGESAILEISSTATGGLVKQETRDGDYVSNCSTSVDGSMVVSPSLDSFSTLPEQEISDFQVDSRDMQIKVDNPQKHLETLETYITFRITTKTTRPEFEESQYVVRRRYNDFIWLHKKLIESYPAHIIPPMPGKHTLLAQLDRYSKEFIIARMNLLHIFLNRVVIHPILSSDKNLHIFLTCKRAEFAVHRNKIVIKLTDAIPFVTNPYTIKRRPQEFDKVLEYCSTLCEKISTIDKINHRIHKERQDYLFELHQLHPIFSLWATSEPELSPLLLAIARAIELNAVAHEKLLENVPNKEREYISYIEAVKSALSRVDGIQMEYEITVDELAKRKAEKDQLLDNANGRAPGQSWGGSLWKAETRDEKLERLDQIIPRLAIQAEILQDRVLCANENFRSDLQRWDIEKQGDLKNLLLSMANKQIDHYQQCMDGWEGVLSGLKLDDIRSDNITVGPTVKIPM